MASGLDARQVMGLVATALGAEPLAATHLPFGHSSVSYDVALPGRNVIVRTNARPEVFAKTGHNLAILAGLGLPVPRLLVADLTKSRYPAAYLILDKIPGRDLRYELAGMTAAQMTRLAGRIVAFQRRVATLPPGAGFGWAPIGERGPFPSWEGLIRSELRGRADLPGDAAAELTARLERALPRFAPHFAGVRPGCFLDDVTIKNVIVQAGELRGLVDFDSVCYGDPLYPVGLTAAGVVSDVGPRGSFYVEELCRCWGLDGRQRRVVALYSALHALNFLRRSSAAETAEWTQRMVEAARRWLAPLE
jgi:aminoglycoside phosphotransferase (APT) family kinase protein